MTEAGCPPICHPIGINPPAIQTASCIPVFRRLGGPVVERVVEAYDDRVPHPLESLIHTARFYQSLGNSSFGEDLRAGSERMFCLARSSMRSGCNSSSSDSGKAAPAARCAAMKLK